MNLVFTQSFEICRLQNAIRRIPGCSKNASMRHGHGNIINNTLKLIKVGRHVRRQDPTSLDSSIVEEHASRLRSLEYIRLCTTPIGRDGSPTLNPSYVVMIS